MFLLSVGQLSGSKRRSIAQFRPLWAPSKKGCAFYNDHSLYEDYGRARSNWTISKEKLVFSVTLLRRIDGRPALYRLHEPVRQLSLADGMTRPARELPVGANRGYVGLTSEPALLNDVNKVLTDLQTTGTVAELGRAAGLTYLPPREPAILGEAWLKTPQK